MMTSLVNPAANELAMSLKVTSDPSLRRALNARSGPSHSEVANQLDFEAWRSDSIWDSIHRAKADYDAEVRHMLMLRTIQRCVRGWIARRRYRRHKENLQQFVLHLKVQMQSKAAVRIQSSVRKMLAKKELVKLREEVAARRAEEEAKSKKKKKGGKAAAGTLDPLQAYMLEHDQFLRGMTAFLAFRYDDAISAFEKHLKKIPGERITERLLERCRTGKAVILEQAKKEAEEKKALAAQAKASKSSKAAPKPQALAAAAPPEVLLSVTNENDQERRASAGVPGHAAAVGALPLEPKAAKGGKLPQVAAEKGAAAPVARRSSTPTLPKIAAAVKGAKAAK